MDFAGPLPDENNKDVYILVGVDRFSRFPYAKVVTNNKADTIIKFMQTHWLIKGYQEMSGATKLKGFGLKNLESTVKAITLS